MIRKSSRISKRFKAKAKAQIDSNKDKDRSRTTKSVFYKPKIIKNPITTIIDSEIENPTINLKSRSKISLFKKTRKILNSSIEDLRPQKISDLPQNRPSTGINLGLGGYVPSQSHMLPQSAK
mmetsp:Transcript_23369/g.20762  ORF Transcript_23369/g.20762 Transcript_23369/m.20762 type:complete len:122 (+) Transcript_23369:460-825(+)